MQINSNFKANVNVPEKDDNQDEFEAVPTSIADLVKDENSNGIPDFADEILKNSKQNGQTKSFNKMFNVNPFVTQKVDDVVIKGEVIDNNDINKTFDANQQINPNSRNLPKGPDKTDLGLLLVIVALVFVVILYFIFR